MKQTTQQSRRQMGDAVPQTPWDFSLKAENERDRVQPKTRTRSRSFSLPGARRSRCIPAELYPPVHQTKEYELDNDARLNYEPNGSHR